MSRVRHLLTLGQSSLDDDEDDDGLDLRPLVDLRPLAARWAFEAPPAIRAAAIAAPAPVVDDQEPYLGLVFEPGEDVDTAPGWSLAPRFVVPPPGGELPSGPGDAAEAAAAADDERAIRADDADAQAEAEEWEWAMAMASARLAVEHAPPGFDGWAAQSASDSGRSSSSINAAR